MEILELLLGLAELVEGVLSLCDLIHGACRLTARVAGRLLG
ncbi:MAG: hypothetical protein ACJ8J0_27060 [Longimicrobiaceae bacterium]